MVKGNLASKASPHQLQETFSATDWKTGNTGRTKAVDYNKKFRMLYRVVNSNNRILDTKSILVKKNPQTPDIAGGRDNDMVPPHDAVDPDPAAADLIVGQDKLTVFSSLPSIQAARQNKDSLNISYDCEYQAVDENGNPDINGKKRIILSYQYALYLNKSEILEIVFVSLNPSVNNRLGYRVCLGAILELLVKEYHYTCLSYQYSDTRQFVATRRSRYFEGSDDTYNYKKAFDTVEEAKEYLDNQNPMVVIDKSNKKVNDYKNARKNALSVTLVCHTGVVDLSAFANDIHGIGRKGNILPIFKAIQGGLVTMDNIFTHVPTASEYWKFYPVRIEFRDTMCYA